MYRTAALVVLSLTVVKRFHLHRDAGQASESRGTEAACSYDQLEVLS